VAHGDSPVLLFVSVRVISLSLRLPTIHEITQTKHETRSESDKREIERNFPTCECLSIEVISVPVLILAILRATTLLALVCVLLVPASTPAQPDNTQRLGRATELIKKGDAFLARGNADKAEENYLRALNEQSDNAGAMLGLARVAQGKGDHRTAALYLFRARNLVENSPDLLYRFALVAARLELFEEAKSALERAIKLNPNEPDYLLALGAIWIRRPDFAAAEQAFRRAIQLQPDSVQAQIYLGYILIKQKKYAEARLLLERAMKSDANRPEPIYYLGLIAQEEGEDQRALEIFAGLAQRFPEFREVHLPLGSLYLKLKDYVRAQRELEMAVKMKPDEPTAHYQLALLFARIKNPERAQEEMRIVEKLKNAGKGREEQIDVPAPAKPNLRH
jgi:Tfp pilus assembly protein PilF